MPKRAVALVMAAGLSAITAFAADAPVPDRAKTLVRALGTDQLIVAAVATSTWTRCKRSPADKGDQCDKLVAAIRQTIDRGRLVDLIAPFFAEQFTVDEIDAMLAFFDSDHGRQFTAATIRALELGPSRAPPQLDRATIEKFSAWAQTPVARKFGELGTKYGEESSRRVAPYLCPLLEPSGLSCAMLTRMAGAGGLVAAVPSQPSSDGADEAYQRDADVVRARHLLEWAQIIEAYYEKSGRYPLQGRVKGDELLRVRIATREQQSFLDPAHPSYRSTFPLNSTSLTPVSVKEFVADIEEVLGREIVERYDPQRVPTGAPNYFTYFATKDGYLIWAVCRTCPPQLRAETIPLPPDARTFNIGSAWFIQNVPRTRSLAGLQANKDFVQFVGSGPKRSGSFEMLARDQARESKQ